MRLYRKTYVTCLKSPSLYGGSYHALEVQTADCYVYERETGDEKHLIALNFSAEARSVSIYGAGTAKIALSTHMDRDGSVFLDKLALRPYEGVIMQLT